MKWLEIINEVIIRDEEDGEDRPIIDWVAGNPSQQSRDIMSHLAAHSATQEHALFRCDSNDPKYQEGQIVNLPALSFSRTNPNDDKRGGGASEWTGWHKAILYIENPRKGFDIPYGKYYGFNASREKETVVAGRYKVIKKEMVREPHTSESYGYKVPKYTLSDA